MSERTRRDPPQPGSGAEKNLVHVAKQATGVMA